MFQERGAQASLFKQKHALPGFRLHENVFVAKCRVEASAFAEKLHHRNDKHSAQSNSSLFFSLNNS
jgi:hypothetical protein